MGIINRLQSWFQLLTSDPLRFIISALYYTVAIVASLVLHECAHAYIAYRCGDPTAKMLGRLTLNPLKHLEPIGTLCLVFLGFGWAKPVPIDPRNFENRRRDDLFVSIAGIVTNFTLYLLSTIIFLLGYKSGLMFTTRWFLYVIQFLSLFRSLNLSLAIFNFLPIPPLDGFHILNDLILKGRLRLNMNVFRISQAVLMLLCLTGILGRLLSTVISTVDSAVFNLLYKIIGGF